MGGVSRRLSACTLNKKNVNVNKIYTSTKLPLLILLLFNCDYQTIYLLTKYCKKMRQICVMFDEGQELSLIAL